MLPVGKLKNSCHKDRISASLIVKGDRENSAIFD